MTENLSLGHTFLEANGLTGTPVVTLNYVNPDHRLVLPYPDGDWYLRSTAVPAARRGEIVVCNRLIDGLSDYYRKLGFIPSGATIEEVDPKIEEGLMYGFPATDPLESLASKRFLNGTAHYLASTFYGDLVSSQARRLGLEDCIRPDSTATNNKADLRRFARTYGYNMLPGGIIEDKDDLILYSEELKYLRRGVWLKFPTGSGGDLVRYHRYVTAAGLSAGIQNIRETVLQAFDKGRFDANPDDFWPKDLFVPREFPVVIEEDARNLGEVLVNGSTQFITKRDGSVNIIGHFRQMTTEDGEYLGNRPFHVEDPAVDWLIKKQVRRVARYNMMENGYFGIQGTDWFLLRDNSGRLKVRITELNSRPTANTPPVIIASRFGVKAWVNTNVYTDVPIERIGDFASLVGEELAYGDPYGDGLIVPQAFRTLVSGNAIYPSPNFKALIMGRSDAHCSQIIARLSQKGVRFSP